MAGNHEQSDSPNVTGANATGADGRQPQQDQNPAEGQRQQGNAQMGAGQQSGQQQSGQQQQFDSSGGGQPGGGGQHGNLRTDLREHMEVIGADGVHVGTIDGIEGDRIKLTKRDAGQGSHEGHHHYLPLGLVAGIEGDKVRLSANGREAYGFEEEK